MMTVQPDNCDGRIGDLAALAEHIAHYPRVRLCHNVDGASDGRDWLLHERDRYLIVQALRRVTQQPDDRQKPWACWRCNQLNSEWAAECGRCGQPMKRRDDEQAP